MEIIGDPQRPGKPSDDRPMLPIVTVPNALGLRSGTPIQIRLATTADSGHLVNGNTVSATLSAPLAGLPAGTPVTLTVIMAARAGAMDIADAAPATVTESEFPAEQDFTFPAA